MQVYTSRSTGKIASEIKIPYCIFNDKPFYEISSTTFPACPGLSTVRYGRQAFLFCCLPILSFLKHLQSNGAKCYGGAIQMKLIQFSKRLMVDT